MDHHKCDKTIRYQSVFKTHFAPELERQRLETCPFFDHHINKTTYLSMSKFPVNNRDDPLEKRHDSRR